MSCPIKMFFYKDGELIGERWSNLGWFPPEDNFKYAFECLELFAEHSKRDKSEVLPPEGWDEVEILGERRTRDECREKGIKVADNC